MKRGIKSKMVEQQESSEIWFRFVSASLRVDGGGGDDARVFVSETTKRQICLLLFFM